jgi:predicted molibdopterin-dependent oxidoreductase YjgC
MCDMGRLIYQELADRSRIETPLVRADRELERALWDGAMAEAWRRLADSAERHGEGTVAAVASARAGNEAVYLLRRLVRDCMNGLEPAFPQHVEGEDDGFLLNADRTPNRRGAREICGDEAVGGAGLERIRAGIEAGTVKALVVMDEDLTEMEGWGGLPLERLEALVVLSTFESRDLLDAAHVALPLAAWVEGDGTYVNFQGRVQRLRAAVRPAGESRPGWKILADLLALAGREERYQGPREIMSEISNTVPSFRGLTYPALGEDGLPLAEGAPVSDASREEGA